MRDLRRLSWDEPAPGDLLYEWLEEQLEDEADDTPEVFSAKP